MNIPVLVADLVGVRVQGPVGGDDAVAIERAVRRIIFIEITTEREDVVGSALVGRPAERLVNKIPDEVVLTGLLGSFVLNRSGRIIRFEPVVAGDESIAESGLVAKAPDNNRRV